MPRRAPPSSLRLAQGPTPSRDTPKHRLPSLPRPAFRIREEESVVVLSNQGQPRTRTDESLQVVIPEASRRLRGPWDHSGSINISVDVDQLLPRLNRAMIVLRG